jgi:hypothetical protein
MDAYLNRLNPIGVLNVMQKEIDPALLSCKKNRKQMLIHLMQFSFNELFSESLPETNYLQE